MGMSCKVKPLPWEPKNCILKPKMEFFLVMPKLVVHTESEVGDISPNTMKESDDAIFIEDVFPMKE